MLPRDIREDIYEGILSNDIVAFHTRSYQRNFLLCCRELFDLDVDEEAGVVHFDGRDVWVRAYPLPISAETFRAQRPAPGGPRVRARDPAPPPRAPDPARGPRRPVEERAARLHRVRPVPRAAPRVPRAGHVHRPPDPLAPGRARVRRVPGAHRGARGGREPPPRHDRLDADRAAAAREPRGGDRRLQALRPADGQRDVRRHEPDRQGGPARQRAQRRVAAEREHGRPRGARPSSPCR